MYYSVEASCSCNRGKVRKNNEDNFYFDGRCLPRENNGLRHAITMRASLRKEQCLAVFDGMGGENYGEYASFAAAECMKEKTANLEQYVVPEKVFLNDLCLAMNQAVNDMARAMRTRRMGSTVAALMFYQDFVYSCNVGDSRCYRYRNGVLLQLSEDHVDEYFVPSERRKKPALSQCLGISEDEFVIEPYIAKGEVKRGDRYLICSDGLTDMLTDKEISGMLDENLSMADCTEKFVLRALENGGHDNVTVIVCEIQ